MWKVADCGKFGNGPENWLWKLKRRHTPISARLWSAQDATWSVKSVYFRTASLFIPFPFVPIRFSGLFDVNHDDTFKTHIDVGHQGWELKVAQ